MVGDKEPIYDFTLEDLGRFNEQPVLPFNAYGTLAWARAEFENNSASSQVRSNGRRMDRPCNHTCRVATNADVLCRIMIVLAT